MPINKVNICNTALSRIGISSFITDIEENSVEAAACRVVYDQSVERFLRDFHWPFAKAYADLTLVLDEESTSWKTDWAYRYRYPNAAVAVRRIVTAMGRREPVAAPYSIGRDSDGKLIYTDVENAVAEITHRETDPSLFDPMFASALSWHIAAEICMPLSAADNFRKQAMQGFVMDFEAAKRIAVNEDQSLRDIDTEFVNSRFTPTIGGVNDLAIFPSGFSVG